MAHYSPIFCSCIVCKTVVSTAQLPNHTHNIHQHLHPKPPKNFGKCLQCDDELRGYVNVKFCNRSCSASYTNKLRSDASRKKQAKTLKETVKDKKQNGTFVSSRPIISKCNVYFKSCQHCNISFTAKSSRRQLCSMVCLKNVGSIRQTHRLKTDPEYRAKLGSSNRSYPELQFSAWLDKHTVPHVIEKQFQNKDTENYYFADFYFEELQLIIEIDGSQHLKTMESDAYRDRSILEQYDINTIRIPAIDFLKGRWEEKLKELLVATKGLEPLTHRNLEFPALPTELRGV